ncbi:MAG TPA: DUF4159 domain-containing protein, partial [Geminicoccaceae bacterium]|nr:DUF4159 domain-containing protein [Geminicoccaceae bacterium]
MLNLGLLGFTAPWLLAALALLPVLYWLLRVIPPTPRRVRFPAIRFLFGIESREETPARTPPWLLALRLLIATLVILALAGPLLYPEPELEGDGPLVLVVDDGWAAAPGWERRVTALERFTQRAVREGREVVLVGTAPEVAAAAPTVRRLSAPEAANVAPSWQLKPWPVDRAAALRAVGDLGLADAEIVWLSDGVAHDGAAYDGARAFAEGLAGFGRLRVLNDPPEDLARLLLPPEAGAEGLDVAALRPAAGPALTLPVRALGPTGEVLAQRPLTFAEGERRGQARLDLPLELRNRIARLELVPLAGIGEVALLDERWRRRVVGLVGGSAESDAQPLLSELYYVERALGPHAELRRGEIDELVAGRLSALVLGDVVLPDPTLRAQVGDWIERGGVLLRFAGPHLAAGADELVPVRLRLGDRNLGGALSWAQPLPLASFDPEGPLAGLRVPDDVLVSRQVLAQPGPELAKRTWARLDDGTPLITAEQRGQGWLVLVHTTPNTIWSNFALSGAFVDVLRRVVALSPGVGGEPTGLLAPLEVLDARGRLQPPGATVQPVAADRLGETPAGPLHPAGLYGRPGAGEDAHRHALNLASAIAEPRALGPDALTVRPRAYVASAEVDLMPWLLLAALLLAFADTLIGLALRGLLPAPRRPATGGAAAAAAFLAVALLPAAAPLGQEADDQDLVAATAETHLAYVLTGIGEVDDVSRAGLEGLSLVLNQRTAVEATEPLPVDLEADDLAVYPLLYWPVPDDHPDLPAGVVERVDAYLRQGGMILFDTRDAGVLLPGQPGPGPGELRL